MAVQSFKGTTTEFGSELEKDIDDVESSVSKKVQDLTKKAKGTATEALESVETMIEKNPTQALLIGIGIGALVGVTLTRLLRR